MEKDWPNRVPAIPMLHEVSLGVTKAQLESH